MALNSVTKLLKLLLENENVSAQAELQSSGELAVSLRVNGLDMAGADEILANIIREKTSDIINLPTKRAHSNSPEDNVVAKRQVIEIKSDEESLSIETAEPFSVIDLNSGRAETTTGIIPSEAKLVQIYPQLSNRKLHRYYPTVWDSNGKFTLAYEHLRNTPRGKPPRTIPNKEWLKWCQLFDRIFQCYPIDIPKHWTRIVVGITRSSNTAPVYGRGGIVDRAGTAAKAWIRLRPEDAALIIVHTRARVSSSAPLDTKAAYIQEILRLLSAANERPGTRVELVSVRIDALTTDVPSLAWVSRKYPNVQITIVYVVQMEFPGTENFPVYSNEVRYGKFALQDIVRAIDGDETLPAAKLVKILNLINQGKGGYGGLTYRGWTLGRNGFRVCPESKTESGIAEDRPLLSRGLH